MSKHTPGPWKIIRGDDELFISSASRKGKVEIATIDTGYIRSFAAEQRANARLIAAAPDLLENLQGCMEALASHVPDCIEVKAARDAIAKATGSES